MKTVCVLGEGAWGTAIACLLADQGFTVTLWCYHHDVAQAIKMTRYNERYLPGVRLSDAIIPTIDFQAAVADVEWIFEAIPVQYLRNVLSQHKTHVHAHHRWVVLSKGIEQKTLLFPSELIDDVLGFQSAKIVLAGPSYAQHLAKKQITAFTLATTDNELGLYMQTMLANHYCRPYLTLDLMGVQVGAACKNVIALAIGMLDGAGCVDNTRAFVLTRGLAEIVLLTQVLGGKPETVYGLSGVGDLVLTALGKYSKNREVGRRLGAGQSLETILQETGFIPEGVNTAHAVYQLIQQKNLELPLCGGVYDVIHHRRTISDVIQELMSRPLQWE